MNALLIFTVLIAGGFCAAPPMMIPDDEENPCEDQPTGHKLPITGTCSDFYVCLNKRSVKQTCGAMYFNTKTQGCDLPQNVDCLRPVELPVPKKIDICEGRKNMELIASRENCMDYVVCLWKMVIPRSCGWMHFDEDMGKCVDPRFSKCDPAKLVPKPRPLVVYRDAEGKAIYVPVLLMSGLHQA